MKKLEPEPIILGEILQILFSTGREYFSFYPKLNFEKILPVAQ